MARTEQSSNKKQCNISTNNQNVSTLDRLSELPDSLICHILSFLSTKQSMATSILGRRWRFLWTDVPNLRMKDYDHTSSKGEPSFSDVMNRIFILYNVKVMNTFTLNIYEDFDDNCINEYQIATWITAAVSRKVRKLNLSLSTDVRLPQCLFTSKMLVHLILRYCALPILPSDICFPSLKTLILECVAFQSGENFLRLISGCPVLEELEIDQILDNVLFCCSISSPTIKWLKISVTFERQELEPNGYRLEINSPALRYLILNDYLSQHISIEVVNSLVEANIILRLYEEAEIDEPEDRVDYSGTLLEFIHRLCNVKCLKLFVDDEKILDSTFMASPIRYHNLTKLELSADWRFISKFLESADNLEILIIGWVKGVLKRWREPKQVPPCLLSHLTTIRINTFRLADNEIEMVRYLLKNAQVLQVMTIYSAATSDYKKKFCALQKISQFERASVACKLYFE